MQNWLFESSVSFLCLIDNFIFRYLLRLVYSGITERFDQNVILFFSENVGNPSLDLFMQYVTESGEVLWMLGFAILILDNSKNT